MSLSDGALYLIASALAAAAFTWLTFRSCLYFGILADRENGIQRMHRHWAPRLGGVPVFITVCLTVVFAIDLPERETALLLLACALPAVFAGLSEDMFENMGARVRLFATFVSAWLAWFLIDGKLVAVDLPGFDWALGYTWVALLFTAFAVGGVAHSVNIIDGFNGLSSFYSVICFAAIFIVASIVGDEMIQSLSLIFCGALLGFLVWNFPFGRVFLGDCGAYFIGFALGEISVLLVARNPEVSPWFCCLLMAYPIWDTLFSSYRREFKQQTSWSEADALHLHHLIFRRLVRPYVAAHQKDRVILNSLASVYVWTLGLMCAVPAVLFWDSSLILGSFTVLFVVSYSLLYRLLVKFRAPRMLLMPVPRRKATNLLERAGLISK